MLQQKCISVQQEKGAHIYNIAVFDDGKYTPLCGNESGPRISDVLGNDNHA